MTSRSYVCRERSLDYPAIKKSYIARVGLSANDRSSEAVGEPLHDNADGDSPKKELR